MTKTPMTCCEQLDKLQQLAELVGATILQVPPAKFEHQPTAYVSRVQLAKIETALIAAGYDMPAIRKRFKEQRKAEEKRQLELSPGSRTVNEDGWGE